MGVRSGVEGELLIGSCNLLEFSMWDLEYGSDTQTYSARSGGGAQQTVAGEASGSGNIECAYNDEALISAVAASGALVTLTCRSASGSEHTGQARLGKYKLGANRDGSVQKISVPFTTHGVWTLDT